MLAKGLYELGRGGERAAPWRLPEARKVVGIGASGSSGSHRLDFTPHVGSDCARLSSWCLLSWEGHTSQPDTTPRVASGCAFDCLPGVVSPGMAINLVWKGHQSLRNSDHLNIVNGRDRLTLVVEIESYSDRIKPESEAGPSKLDPLKLKMDERFFPPELWSAYFGAEEENRAAAALAAKKSGSARRVIDELGVSRCHTYK
jgi:hypothetical protein